MSEIITESEADYTTDDWPAFFLLHGIEVGATTVGPRTEYQSPWISQDIDYALTNPISAGFNTFKGLVVQPVKNTFQVARDLTVIGYFDNNATPWNPYLQAYYQGQLNGLQAAGMIVLDAGSSVPILRVAGKTLQRLPGINKIKNPLKPKVKPGIPTTSAPPVATPKPPIPSCSTQGLPGCFAAGTPLLTPDGPIPIELLNVGDYVLSRSEWDANGVVEPKMVVEVYRRLSQIIHLHVGDQVIKTTGVHPFFVLGKDWILANEIKPGDRLVGHDNQAIIVDEVFDTGEYEVVYNLQIADHHTYFVGRKEWGFSVWSHNAECAILIQDGNKFLLKSKVDGKLLKEGSKTEVIDFAKANGHDIAPDKIWTKASAEHIQETRSNFEKSGGVREQYWKNQYETNKEVYSPGNQALIKQGKAPFGTDGKPMVLHHKTPIEYGGTNDFSNLQPMRYSDHSLVPNFGPLHTPPFPE